MTNMFNTASDRPNAPNIAIVITDGASNIDKDKTIPYAKEAHRRGIRMFAIGIGNGVEVMVMLFFLIAHHSKMIVSFRVNLM